jgi:hypothetical protein
MIALMLLIALIFGASLARAVRLEQGRYSPELTTVEMFVQELQDVYPD